MFRQPTLFSCFCFWHAAICAAAAQTWQPCAVCHTPNNINFLWKTSWDQRKANFHSTWNNKIVSVSVTVVVTFWSGPSNNGTDRIVSTSFAIIACISPLLRSLVDRVVWLAFAQWTKQWAQRAIEPGTNTCCDSFKFRREVYYQNNLLDTVSTLALIYRSRIGSRRAAAFGSREGDRDVS